MEVNTLRLSFLLIFPLLLLLFLACSWLPFYGNDADNLLDCSNYSPWCTSKNRFQSHSNHLLRQKSETAKSINHETRIPLHPLDPLTLQEINKARSILFSHQPFSSSSSSSSNNIHTLILQEPDKKLVLKWRKGDPLPPRQASAIVLLNGESHLVTIDLDTSKIVKHDIVPSSSGYPMMTIEDMTSATTLPLSDLNFTLALANRGIDLADVACLPITGGWFGKKEENQRVIRVQCYSLKGTANFYMRPIEGLTATFDMDRKQVVEIADSNRDFPVPSSKNTDYRYGKTNKPVHLKLLKPISLEQPKGPSFTVEDGHTVKWANWEFHLKPDPRAGAILSQVNVLDPDSGKLRNVLFKGMTSELFVPYMDPTDAWYFKTYMDAGEYGFGLQAMPLDPLNDCPRNAFYMDGVFAAADGKPFVRSNMVCVFESYAGEIGWRHSESPITGMGIREVRPKVKLIVRMAASVANYDYIVDWEFQTDGLIRIKDIINLTIVTPENSVENGISFSSHLVIAMHVSHSWGRTFLCHQLRMAEES